MDRLIGNGEPVPSLPAKEAANMTERICKTSVTAASAILLAAVMGGARPAMANSWQQTAAATYSWATGANWDSAFPNAPGAVANFSSVSLAGAQTVNLNQPITIGTLNAGDPGGSPAPTLTIGSGTGGNPLVFQGATAGAPTAINFNPTVTPSGGGLNVSAGISLGGTSPLTMTLNGTAYYQAKLGGVALNGNTFTVTGAYNSELNPGVISGNGTFLVNGLGGDVVNTGTAGVVIDRDLPNFTGTLAITDGHLQMVSANLSAVSQIRISGAFQSNDKYPIGGWFQIGNTGWPAVTTLPDRLNHNAVMAFDGGGYLEYRGQCLSSSLAGQAVVEQVRQIQFNSGLSEIRILNGNNVSTSTTLLANDPTNACVRNQGATLIIGGDDSASGGGTFWKAMGVVEKLKFASGMSGFMKGGGGAAGSTTISLIPWMSIGTIYHPNQGMVTYDNTNGIRCLNTAEYYTGTILGCDPASNVQNSSLNLGTGKSQTINAYITSGWANQDIGPGSTLTIASGYLSFWQSPGSIGNGTAANAGTLNFGAAEGIIWTNSFPTTTPNYIGSVIAGSGGLTKTGNATLVLKAANTYTGTTYINSGFLQVGDGTLTTSKLGVGDLVVSAGATLLIKSNVANAVSDTKTITLNDVGDSFYGMVSLESGINEKVGGLVLNGVVQPAGTYGSSSSAATYQLDNYFSGPGVLTVVPEPAALGLLGIGGLMLGRRRRG